MSELKLCPFCKRQPEGRAEYGCTKLTLWRCPDHTYWMTKREWNRRIVEVKK